MQQRLTFALLALLVTGSAAASSAAAASAAKAWLQSHKAPTEDQLGELQNSNPAAFAIVSALLKKHQSGGGVKLAAEDRGPDVFRRMMSQGSHLATHKPSIALPYSSEELEQVSAPVVVDQAQYNPNQAVDRDESAVSRLLSAVASMGGEKGRKIGLLNKRRVSTGAKKVEEENPLENDASLFAEQQSHPTPAPIEALEQSVAQVQAQQAPHENSYLKGIDLSGDMPQVLGAAPPARKAVHHVTEGAASNGDFGSSLASFSFGDDAAPATPAPKKVEEPKPKKENAFLNWLGFTKKAPAPVEKPAAPTAPAEKPAAGSYYSQFMSL